jgi:DNA-directed RNA polymerase beta' subunit
VKATVFNLDKFVEVNNLQEIKDPILLERDRTPTTEGLFSYEIFGRPGSSSRKSTFAYIDLKSPYFNPLVYKTLKRIDRKFDECLTGVKQFRINEQGVLEVDEENGSSGLDFLYKNWNKIKFPRNDSRDRTERIRMIEGLKKDEIFMSKQIVIPPALRDINLADASSGKIGHDAVNDKYAKLIRLVQTQSLTSGDATGFDFLGNMTKVNIQNVLVEIYNYFMDYIKGKDGIFRSFVMGKSIDYGARLVISSPIFNDNSYKDMKVNFEYTGVPLAQAITIFFPFTIKWVNDWFEKNLFSKKTIMTIDPKTGEEKNVLIGNMNSKYNHDKITKYIKRFIKSPSERFEVIKAETVDGKEFPLQFSYVVLDDSGAEVEQVTRPLTWTDLFFQCAVDIVKDKHVYITRYPLEDYMCVFPSKVRVISTFKTQKVRITNNLEQLYNYYPFINLDAPQNAVSSMFIDSLQLFNAMLKSIGGDYDGIPRIVV